MPLIDDDGKIFGVVNVIDALVIIVLIGILVGGVAVFTNNSSNGTSDTELGYATIELGEQPEYVVDQFDEGDDAEVSGWGSGEQATMVTVTDTDVADTITNETNDSDTDAVDITIRIEFEGVAVEDERGLDVFQVEGEPVLIGTDIRLDRGTYVTKGTVTEFHFDEPTFQTDPRQKATGVIYAR